MCAAGCGHKLCNNDGVHAGRAGETPSRSTETFAYGFSIS